MDNFIKVLCSGSKGNSILISFEENTYIIDIGISLRKFKNKLGENFNYDDVTMFITHDHGDHSKGLTQYLKHHNPSVYGSNYVASKYRGVKVINEKLELNNICIEPLFLSHDSEDTQGYIFYLGDYKVVIVSDTGYLSDINLGKMRDCDVLLLESNHDVNMLMEGKYNWLLKNRVVGDYGHLSNYQFGTYCNSIVTNNTKYVVALHLSEENNCASKVQEILDDVNVEAKYIATQQEGAETIYLNWR